MHTVTEGQTLVDLAIQYGGNVSFVVSIAALNSLSITSKLIAGQQLMIPAEAPNPSIALYFKDKNLAVNTGSSSIETPILTPQGIDFDNNDFDNNDFN